MWFQDLKKLRFLMSHPRKNSSEDKVIGKKWIYLEGNTPQTECGPPQNARVASKYGMVRCYGVSSLIG